MLILRTSIRILLLLIIAICYQITTNNNTSLYLQLVYAANSDCESTRSEEFHSSNVLLSDLLRQALAEREQAKNNNTNISDNDDNVSGYDTDDTNSIHSINMYPSSEFDDFDSDVDDDHQYDTVYSDVDDDNISTDTNYSNYYQYDGVDSESDDEHHYDSLYSSSDIDNTSAGSAPKPNTPAGNDNNDHHISELQKSSVINNANTTQYHNTSRAIIHYTSIPMKVINNFISRKVNNSSSSQVRYIGASESNSILHQKKYELECKYVYNATTMPQKNALGKASTMGAIINLKYQFSSKLTAGMFYAPTVTTYTMHNQGNNNTIAATTKENIVNHCIGMYTSYAITPATYLSNQVSVGFSITNDKNRDKNSSNKSGHPHYFAVDSFVSHKIKVDDTKTISPFLGLSYYSANPRLYHSIGDVNNLSSVMGVKFQYEYKHKDLVFAPWLKLTHTRSLYSNINAKIQDKSIIAQGEHLIDVLRDFHVAFNPNSSVTLALSIRRRALRFAAGYEYSIHHECDNSYSHTFFARINIAF